jgi:hypothetical protein
MNILKKCKNCDTVLKTSKENGKIMFSSLPLLTVLVLMGGDCFLKIRESNTSEEINVISITYFIL